MGANLKEAALMIAQDVRRNGNDGKGYNLNSENWNVFNRILDIFDSVSVERESRPSQKKSQNPLQDFFKILTENPHSQADNFNSVLSLDSKKLAAILNEIAKTLLNQQNNFDAQITSLKEMHQQNYGKLEAEYNAAKKQIGDYQFQRKSVAESLQYLMAKFGNDKDLARTLKIMGLKAVFPEEIDEEKISQYFTTLKTDLPNNECISPCIMFGDEIFIHGEIIKYVEKS